MLGRKDFTQDEIDAGKRAVKRALDTLDTLPKTAQSTLQQGGYFNDLALGLDRRYVHRLRGVTGKDGTPLNELELLVESLMNNDGVLRGNNVVKYAAEKTVVGLKVGDRITLSRDDFDRLSSGVFAELEQKYR
ncbi:MAG TPA: hypothetical protein VGH43_18540 [Jatrophihabitans sp.]|jgi:hypothetical protein